MESKHVSNTETYFFSDLLDSMINMKRYLMMRQKAGLASKSFNLPTVDLKDE